MGNGAGHVRTTGPGEGTGPGAGAVVTGLAASLLVVAVPVAIGLLAHLASGWTRLFWSAVTLLLAWQLLPRPTPRPRGTVVVDPGSAPALGDLLTRVGAATGATVPRRVLAVAGSGTRVLRLGLRREPALVVDLHEWTVRDPDERVALLATELVLGDRLGSGRWLPVDLGLALLGRLVRLLTPSRVTARWDETIDQSHADLGLLGAGQELAAANAARQGANAVGAAGVDVLSLPFRGALRALHRLAAPGRARAGRAADLAAARLVGPDAVRSSLLATLTPPRGVTAAANAARTGGDPFAAAAAAGRPEPAELARRVEVARADGTRTAPDREPTTARLDDLGGLPSSADPGLAGLVDRADAELATSRSALRRSWADDLAYGAP